MLFPYPSFINQKEQDASRILYNNVSLVLRSQLNSVWFNLGFGSNLRDLLQNGIDALVMAQAQEEIERALLKYFGNDLRLFSLEIWQEDKQVKAALTYIELRTGKYNTVQTEYTFANNDATATTV